ncbi:MAG: ABC transporter ATP-binding protein [Candidatus Helarchaeota archaeon]|nr:ABC transporter ATP-binding protein [Candidatus Helarchaeota archaeon]
MSNTNIIEAQNLTYCYPDKTLAIKNVSFAIKTGECVGLIGPNGAGKSTLFLLLMGFFQPKQGTIHIANQELNKKTKKAIRKKIGMVFQDPNDQLFSPSLWEDIAFGPYNLGYNQDEINRRVEETLEIVGLVNLKNKAPHHLSFGEKKKAALATILSMDPEILFLDEPFSNLDPESYSEILELIQNYKKNNLTIIIATHDVDVLPLLVDKCILLDKGQIVSESDIQNILTNHDLLLNHKMRMPLLGQLFYNLRDRNIIQQDSFPITLAKAESFIAELLKAK